MSEGGTLRGAASGWRSKRSTSAMQDIDARPGLHWRAILRTASPFVVVLTLWEMVARAQIFPPRLFPTLETIAAAFVRLTLSGVLPRHAADTVLRLMAGFALAAIAGIAVGIIMGRSRLAEDLALPLVSIAAPIPGIAYAPLFLLWFGLGNVSTVLLVAFVST